MQQSILYRIAVFTSECKFNIKIAACYLNAEVKHIGICKNYFCYVARCFVNGALNFAVNPVYLYGFEFCARYADILKVKAETVLKTPAYPVPFLGLVILSL